MKLSKQSWIYLTGALIFVFIMAGGLVKDSVVDVLYGGISLIVATMFYLK